MENLEIVLKNAQVELPQTIENFEMLKKLLPQMLETYNNLVVTEDSIKGAKEDKAKLNKLIASVEDTRKDVKKKVLSLYEPIEAQCKEIVAMVNAPVEAIDRQLKAFEEKELNDKLMDIKTAFYRMDKPEWLEFDRVLPTKWRNKTEKITKVVEQMQTTVDGINADRKAIADEFSSLPYFSAIAMHFKNTLDKAATYELAIKLGKQHEEEQKRKAEENERIKAAQETQPPVEVVTATTESNVITPQAQQNAVASESQSNTEAKVGTVAFRCTGTAEMIKALGNFMRANGITFEIIK